MKTRTSVSVVARLLASCCGLLLASCGSIFAEEPPVNLISNGDFEADANNDGAPDGWGTPKGGQSWQVEEGNHFYRLEAQEPGKITLVYRLLPIPEGVRALELTWRQRISNLKPGQQAWFDARIMMEWKDAAGQKMKGAPSAPYSRKNTEGWVERSVKFLVPEGAKNLEFMPALFQVQSGTYDLDNFVLKATDAGPLQEAAKARTEASAAKAATDTEKRQANAAKNSGLDGELLPNGDLQLDENADGVPDKWGAGKDGIPSWEVENGNRFMRLTSKEAGKMFLYYRLIDMPAGVRALEFKWKQRITDLKPGKAAWFDARIMMDWLDASGTKLKGGPSAPYARKDTAGWVERSIQFLVPEGAVSLQWMPTLFQVEKGTYDLDDFSLKPTDPAPLLAAAARREEENKFVNVAPEAANKAKWPQPLRVSGNKVLSADGQEVWLQGVNVVSLEWSVQGERVLRNTLTVVDDWKSNVIRLPVKEEYWFGRNPGQKDGGESFRQLVDNVITLAANRGAYVLLDLHRYRAPKQEHAEFWKDAATRYKDHPAVIFDLFNEPHGTSWEVWRNGGFVEDKNAPADEDNFLSPEEKALNKKGFHAIGMQALVDAARGTGAKNIIVAGGLDWAYDLSGIMNGYALDDRGGNGIIYASHIYAGKKDWKGKVLVAADKYPLIISEFGANTKKFDFIPANQQEDADTWVPRILGFIQQHKFHYTAFSFHPGAAPKMLTGWDYTPTPEWGAPLKAALAGKKYDPPQELR